MPRALTSRSSAIAASTSAGVRPAMTSSSNISRGWSASALANSSRRRSGVVRAPAGSAAFGPSPTESSRRSASRSAAPTLGAGTARNSAGTATFWRTVIARKGWAIWKVRASPRRAIAGAPSASSGRPAKAMAPADGGSKPLIRFTRVLLPAPFGPMSPTTSPASIARSTWSTATSRPKSLVSPCTAKRGIRSGSRARPPGASRGSRRARAGGRRGPAGRRSRAGTRARRRTRCGGRSRRS